MAEQLHELIKKNKIREICKKLNSEDQKVCDVTIADIYKLRFKNETVKIADLDSELKVSLNLAVLIELIDAASRVIRVYTDKIKDDIHGNEYVISSLLAWLAKYPHRKLKILLKQQQDKIEDTKLVKAIKQLDKKTRSQVEIRYLYNKGVEDTKFNCMLVDSFAFKIKLLEQKIAFLTFNDTDNLTNRMNVLYDRIFTNSIKTKKVDLNTSYNLISKLSLVNIIDNYYERKLAGKGIPNSFQGFSKSIGALSDSISSSY